MILAYLQSKLAILRWAVIILGLATVFWAGYHTRVILDNAAIGKHTTKLATSATVAVNSGQDINNAIRESKDACGNKSIPAAVLKRLR